MGGNSPAEEERASRAASESRKRKSRGLPEVTCNLYIKSLVTPQMAEMMRNWHPRRGQLEAFSSENP